MKHIIATTFTAAAILISVMSLRAGSHNGPLPITTWELREPDSMYVLTEPAIAAHPDNPDHVLVTAWIGARTPRVGRLASSKAWWSTDGGSRWSGPAKVIDPAFPPGTEAAAGDPWVTPGLDGRLHLIQIVATRNSTLRDGTLADVRRALERGETREGMVVATWIPGQDSLSGHTLFSLADIPEATSFAHLPSIVVDRSRA